MESGSRPYSEERDPGDVVFQVTFSHVLLRKMCGRQHLPLLSPDFIRPWESPGGAYREIESERAYPS